MPVERETDRLSPIFHPKLVRKDLVGLRFHRVAIYQSFLYSPFPSHLSFLSYFPLLYIQSLGAVTIPNWSMESRASTIINSQWGLQNRFLWIGGRDGAAIHDLDSCSKCVGLYTSLHEDLGSVQLALEGRDSRTWINYRWSFQKDFVLSVTYVNKCRAIK